MTIVEAIPDIPTGLYWKQEPLRSKELLGSSKTILVASNTYNPSRNFCLLSNPRDSNRADVFFSIMNRIHDHCYKQMLVKGKLYRPGVLSSFYGTLRAYYEAFRPEDYNQIRGNIDALGQAKEFLIMADTYTQLMLPFESEQTQENMVEFGTRAIEEDLGFKPKGFWLPETAVSKKTLAVLARKGIEFVVLRDNQLRFRGENRPNPVYVGLGEENLNGFPRRIAVIHVDSNISGSVSFDQDATSNVESFFARHGHKSIAYATDTEFYGEHLPFKDMFLDALLNPTTMETFGFSYFDIESKLKQLEEDPQYAEVNDFSSWSCEGYHKLGRWRGDPVCNCDGCIPEFWRENIVGKRQIFLTIRSYQAEIERLLSSKDPLWRDKFVDVSLATRKSMYARGEIEDDIRKLSERTGFENLRDEEIKKLNYALISLWDAKTTCGTFFAKDRRDTERPERAFAYLNFAQIESLIPGIDRLKPPIEYIQACIDQRQRMLAA